MRSSPRKTTPRPRGRRLPLSLFTLAAFAAISLSSGQTTMRARSAPQVLLEAPGASVQLTEGPTPIVTPTGFSGLQLGDEQMSYTVAVRNADGTVRIQHAAGGREAKRQVMAGANRGTPTDRERIGDR